MFKSVPRLVRPWLWPPPAGSTAILTRRISGEALLIITCEKWSGKPIGIFHLHRSGELYATCFCRKQLLTLGGFSRTSDPNTSPAYLAARGYATTANALKKAGTWNAVCCHVLLLRLLDAELKSVDWLEQQQCEILGYPITTLFK